MNGERSVSASARQLWACSCEEAKIDMRRAWGAYAHTLNMGAVFVCCVCCRVAVWERVCVLAAV